MQVDAPIFTEEICKKEKNRHLKTVDIVYNFKMSLFVPEIFKCLKYSNWPNNYAIHSTKF